LPDQDDNASRSQHSFAFDAPVLKLDSNGGKKLPDPITPTPAWVKMTEHYMHKVAAEDPTILTGHNTEGQSAESTTSKPKRLVVQESPPTKENSYPFSKSTVSLPPEI